jgi:hypothetical protein
MIAKNLLESSMQKMGGGMISHDVPFSDQVHLYNCEIPNLRCPLSDCADMGSDPVDRLACIRDSDLPGGQCGGADNAHIRNLTAGLNIKMTLGKRDLDLITG